MNRWMKLMTIITLKGLLTKLFEKNDTDTVVTQQWWYEQWGDTNTGSPCLCLGAGVFSRVIFVRGDQLGVAVALHTWHVTRSRMCSRKFKKYFIEYLKYILWKFRKIFYWTSKLFYWKTLYYNSTSSDVFTHSRAGPGYHLSVTWCSIDNQLTRGVMCGCMLTPALSRAAPGEKLGWATSQAVSCVPGVRTRYTDHHCPGPARTRHRWLRIEPGASSSIQYSRYRDGTACNPQHFNQMVSSCFVFVSTRWNSVII